MGVLSWRDLVVDDLDGAESGMAGWRVRRRPMTVPVDTPLRQVAQLMLEHAVGCLPIVDDLGRPVGLVSRSDLVTALAQHVR